MGLADLIVADLRNVNNSRARSARCYGTRSKILREIVRAVGRAVPYNLRIVGNVVARLASIDSSSAPIISEIGYDRIRRDLVSSWS